MIFRSFDGTITQKISGLKLYQTVYPADMQQDMQPGVANIVSKISTTLKTEPKACFFLQGFSQGAGVNTIFMSKTTGAVADAVIGVLNLGNSMHVANFAANIDDDGGTKSRTCMGPEQKKTPAAVPATWAPKVIDICARVGVARGRKGRFLIFIGSRLMKRAFSPPSDRQCVLQLLPRKYAGCHLHGTRQLSKPAACLGDGGCLLCQASPGRRHFAQPSSALDARTLRLVVARSSRALTIIVEHMEWLQAPSLPLAK